jgi:ubiquitin carboxyl-terminal hydrolase 9/24
MDVDEFLSNFLDALEKELKPYGGQEKIIKDNFEGILSYEVIGKSCPHTSEREEP